MIAVSDLPAVNAALNATAAILIGAGVYFIKRKNIPAHKACMVAALAVSTLFLTSYLTYHYNVGNVRFTKQGWIDRKSTRLNSSHSQISYAVFCLKKKKKTKLSDYIY